MSNPVEDRRVQHLRLEAGAKARYEFVAYFLKSAAPPGHVCKISVVLAAMVAPRGAGVAAPCGVLLVPGSSLLYHFDDAKLIVAQCFCGNIRGTLVNVMEPLAVCSPVCACLCEGSRGDAGYSWLKFFIGALQQVQDRPAVHVEVETFA